MDAETEQRPALWVVRAGTVPYGEATRLQLDVASARRAGEVPDVVLLLEHPPVLTKGRRTDPAELGMGENWYRSQGIEIAEADRGGRVTYHGPGQLVAYPIVDLTAIGSSGSADVHGYVAALERTMIAALADRGVAAQVFDGLTGVWTAGAPPVPIGAPGPEGTTVAARDPELASRPAVARKIGSIGIHVSRGVTTHGLAVNVDNDLQPFEWVVPCGMEAARMTSLARELSAQVAVGELADSIAAALARELGRTAVEVSPEDLTAASSRLPVARAR